MATKQNNIHSIINCYKTQEEAKFFEVLKDGIDKIIEEKVTNNELKELLKHLLDPNPDTRYSCERILSEKKAYITNKKKNLDYDSF